MSLSHTFYASPVGKLLLIGSHQGLRALLWENESMEQMRTNNSTTNPDHPVLKQTMAQLDNYFAKKQKTFTVPLDPVGTDFQQRVWWALRQIPYGETRSYGEQAHMIGQPKAARAVGGANGQNPISIIVPCHRVIGANGKLTGFGGGLAIKQYLLELEEAL